MDNKIVKQGVITDQASIDDNQHTERIALFAADGTAFGGKDVDYDVAVVGTAIGTAAKTTTAPRPTAGRIVVIQFTNGNSANAPTVDFATGDPIPILVNGSAPSPLTLAAGAVKMFFFDGTSLQA